MTWTPEFPGDYLSSIFYSGNPIKGTVVVTAPPKSISWNPRGEAIKNRYNLKIKNPAVSGRNGNSRITFYLT